MFRGSTGIHGWNTPEIVAEIDNIYHSGVGSLISDGVPVQVAGLPRLPFPEEAHKFLCREAFGQEQPRQSQGLANRIFWRYLHGF